MKKILSFSLCVIIIFSLFTISIFAKQTTIDKNISGKCGDDICWIFDENKGVLNIIGKGKMYDYTIEKSEGKYKHTVPWALYIFDITTVNISENITLVGDYAFADCENLKSVILPESITQIGECSFAQCRSIKELTIPDSVQMIGLDAFYGCNSLELNTYDNGEYLGSSENDYLYLVKATDRKISSCIINENTRFIGDQAFFACHNLSTISIPESVEDVGAYVFNGCELLNYNKYENGLYLGNENNPYLYFAKVEKSNLYEIELNPNTEIIGYNAFYDCKSLKNIELPELIKKIPYKGFYGCSSLTSLEIPNAVCKIDDFAFCNCTMLEKISFSANCEVIGASAFVDCTSLKNIRFFGIEYVWKKVRVKGNNENLLASDFEFNPMPFDDVARGEWYYDSVAYGVDKGYLFGVEENKFNPDSALTREQVIQVMFNRSGENKEDWQGEVGFSDVPSTEWYSPAVKWAKENGVTTGVGDGRFGLGMSVTREQLANLLMNYAKFQKTDVSGRADLSNYSDADKISHWAIEGVEWAVFEGLISGTTPTTLSPKMTANRATAAQVFLNYDNNIM